MHVADGGRMNIWISAGAHEGVVINRVTDLARKLQERKWMGGNGTGTKDLRLKGPWVFFIFKEVHSMHSSRLLRGETKMILLSW